MFIGSIVGQLDPLPPEGSQDTRSLLYPTILGAPLIDLQKSIYRKFSGNEGVGRNEDKLGMAIDAFAHAVVVCSRRNVLLVDLQGLKRIDS